MDELIYNGTLKFLGWLGFRDLESFNTMCFVKQWWRLLHHPNTLVGLDVYEKIFFAGHFFWNQDWVTNHLMLGRVHKMLKVY